MAVGGVFLLDGLGVVLERMLRVRAIVNVFFFLFMNYRRRYGLLVGFDEIRPKQSNVFEISVSLATHIACLKPLLFALIACIFCTI